METDYKKTTAIDMLKDLCIARQLVRCDECCFVEPPNGGYGVPYCKLITMIDSCYRNEGDVILYELKDGTVPKECKYWTSLKKTKERKESIQRLGHVQSLIDRLTPAERKMIRLHTF